MKKHPLRVVILISGSGTNLQAIIDAIQRGELNAEIKAVISDRADAHGLTRATQAGIVTEVLLAKDYSSRESYDHALSTLIDQYQAELIVLAGFMRILSPSFVRHFLGRMINIHPALLPKYKGLHTHRRALEAKDAIHGASIHFVTEELDGGPVIAQASLSIINNDTPETLKQKVQQLEHQLYPKVIQWFSEGRLILSNEEVLFDGKRIDFPL